MLIIVKVATSNRKFSIKSVKQTRFTTLFTASKKKRNFILDQTNVYPSARRRKMRNFKGFIRKAAILVPDDAELKRRSDKRTYEDGLWNN